MLKGYGSQKLHVIKSRSLKSQLTFVLPKLAGEEGWTHTIVSPSEVKNCLGGSPHSGKPVLVGESAMGSAVGVQVSWVDEETVRWGKECSSLRGFGASALKLRREKDLTNTITSIYSQGTYMYILLTCGHFLDTC